MSDTIEVKVLLGWCQEIINGATVGYPELRSKLTKAEATQCELGHWLRLKILNHVAEQKLNKQQLPLFPEGANG